jgi:hypothetical protein
VTAGLGFDKQTSVRFVILEPIFAMFCVGVTAQSTKKKRKNKRKSGKGEEILPGNKKSHFDVFLREQTQNVEHNWLRQEMKGIPTSFHNGNFLLTK